MTGHSPIALPPLAWLRAFGAIGRLGSFERAAEELRVKPSTISHQLLALETLLETRLFERSGRAMELTKEGQRYHRVVDDALRRLEDGTRALSTRDRSQAGNPPRRNDG
jgi:LysR family glycine cleavage system transcriptional activator